MYFIFYQGFPAIVVFASSQTTSMYNAIWGKVCEMIPSLRETVTTISADFEMAQINSLKRNFPLARICGCLFHYKQVRCTDRLPGAQSQQQLGMLSKAPPMNDRVNGDNMCARIVHKQMWTRVSTCVSTSNAAILATNSAAIRI